MVLFSRQNRSDPDLILTSDPTNVWKRALYHCATQPSIYWSFFSHCRMKIQLFLTAKIQFPNWCIEYENLPNISLKSLYKYLLLTLYMILNLFMTAMDIILHWKSSLICKQSLRWVLGYCYSLYKIGTILTDMSYGFSYRFSWTSRYYWNNVDHKNDL